MLVLDFHGHCIDASRVFATSMSNGGFLSHRLACELSEHSATDAMLELFEASPMP